MTQAERKAAAITFVKDCSNYLLAAGWKIDPQKAGVWHDPRPELRTVPGLITVSTASLTAAVERQLSRDLRGMEPEVK